MANYDLTRIKDSNSNAYVFGVESISKVNGLQTALDAKATPTDISNAIATEVSNRNTAITNAVNALDVSDSAVANKFVTAVSETNGKIAVTRATLTATNVAQAGTLTNSTSGNASTASVLQSRCTINGNNTNTYMYHRIAYKGYVTSSYNDNEFEAMIRHVYNGGGVGIFKVGFRTDSQTSTASGSAGGQWLCKANIGNIGDVIVCLHKDTTNKRCLCDVFYKTPSSYPRATLVTLSSNGFSFVSSTEASSAASHTECWDSIANAGVALHGEGFTYTTTTTISGTTSSQWDSSRNFSITSSDGTGAGATSSVNGTANVTLKLPSTIKASITGNADTATKATQDGSGNTITSTYVKKSGDTMTGALTMNANANCQVLARCTNTDAAAETDINVHKPGSDASSPYLQLYYGAGGTRGLWDSAANKTLVRMNSDDTIQYGSGKVDGNLTLEKSSWPYLMLNNTNSNNPWGINIKLQQNNNGHCRLIENEPAHGEQGSIDTAIIEYTNAGASYDSSCGTFYSFKGISNRSFADQVGNNIVQTYATKAEAIGVHGASIVPTILDASPMFDCANLKTKKSSDPLTHGSFTGPATITVFNTTIPTALRPTDAEHPRSCIIRITGRYQPSYIGYNSNPYQGVCDHIYQNIISLSGIGDVCSCKWERHGCLNQVVDGGTSNPYQTNAGSYASSHSVYNHDFWNQPFTQGDAYTVACAVNVTASHFDNTMFFNIPYGASTISWELSALAMAGSYQNFGKFYDLAAHIFFI